MATDAAFVTVLLELAQKALIELSEPGMHTRPSRDTFVQILYESLGIRNKNFADKLFEAKPDYKNLDPRNEELSMFNPSSVAGKGNPVRYFNPDYRIDPVKLWRRTLARSISSKPKQYYLLECGELVLRTDALKLFDELEGIVQTGRNRCRCICEDIIYVLQHFDEEIVLVPAVVADQALSEEASKIVH
jgi:hypothetical protein